MSYQVGLVCGLGTGQRACPCPPASSCVQQAAALTRMLLVPAALNHMFLPRMSCALRPHPRAPLCPCYSLVCNRPHCACPPPTRSCAVRCVPTPMPTTSSVPPCLCRLRCGAAPTHVERYPLYPRPYHYTPCTPVSPLTQNCAMHCVSTHVSWHSRTRVSPCVQLQLLLT